MSKDYKKVEILSYVKEGLESGSFIPFVAVKFARVIAREGVEGETIKTMSVDDEGNPIVEKIDTVKVGEDGRLDVVVIKASESGEVIIDENGNKNEWIIERAKFDKKYETTEVEGLYQPKGLKQTFVKLEENIILFQWGKEMTIAKGGYINITDLSDVYGISKRDFDNTYKFSEYSKTYKK